MREQRTAQRWVDAPMSTVSAAGADIVFRELGPRTGVPLVALTHVGANLDDWDPRIVDGLAEERHVVAVGYRGVGASTGRGAGQHRGDGCRSRRRRGGPRLRARRPLRAVDGWDGRPGRGRPGAPSTDVQILPDAGHGAVAQHGRQVVATMLDHLRRPITTHHDQEKAP